MPEPAAPNHSGPRAAAVLVAAGSGTRMGGERNKILLELGGVPVIARAALQVAGAVDLAALIVVAREDERAEIADALAPFRARLPRLWFASGGRERADSVANGIAELERLASGADVVLVHDAARPFPSHRLVRAVLAAARERGAAVPVVAIADTLKRAARGSIVGTVDRRELFGAQTPQGFRLADLAAARRAAASGTPPTDESQWFEAAGLPVAAVAGDPMNLKITHPADLALARALLATFDPELGSEARPR